jgi:cytochrome oxidase assembly protein ShyY1
MYRFLYSARWLGWLALVVLLAAACTALGMWQLDRHRQVQETIDGIESNYDRAPAPYAPQLFATFDPEREWAPVALEGTYDEGGQRVVRNRPLNGRPGYEVLVPLRLDDGNSVVINRGWLPIGNNEAGRPDSVPAPPEGRVSVTARIKPGEPAVNRGAPEGQLASISLPAYRAELGYAVHSGAYGLLARESPAPASAPRPLPRPELDPGPHLSYSMQWFTFGLLLFVGYGYAARQEALNNAASAPGSPAVRGARGNQPPHNSSSGPADGEPGRGQSRKPRRRTAEEEEDAILDAQGY